jgi:hypothetical protein
MSVSSNTPQESAKPICHISESDPANNEANVPAMISPQLVITPPLNTPLVMGCNLDAS